jgi:hypothetical protein
MATPAPALSHRRIVDLLARIQVGHDAANALRRVLDDRTVIVRGVTAAELEGLTATFGACGATVATDATTTGAHAVLFGSRATRRDREAAARSGVPELEQADLDAILTVRAALGDEAPTRPAPPAGLRLVEAA